MDRDGVLNKPVIVDGKSYPPSSLYEYELIAGVTLACMRLKEAGYKLIVVTNQPDVRTGKQELRVVEAMHEKLRNLLPIDDVYVCYHIDADDCHCRKPKAGMMLNAAKDHNIDLSESFMVGDRWKDIEAGQNAGCNVFFIDYGYDEQQPQGHFERVSDLQEAAKRILAR